MSTELVQASPSVSDISDNVSDISSATVKSLGEADLVTGIIDITNVRTYMVPPVKNWDRAKGMNDVVRVFLHLAGHDTKYVRFHQEKHILSLQVIPREYRAEWTLNHPSNAIWRTVYHFIFAITI